MPREARLRQRAKLNSSTQHEAVVGLRVAQMRARHSHEALWMVTLSQRHQSGQLREKGSEIGTTSVIRVQMAMNGPSLVEARTIPTLLATTQLKGRAIERLKHESLTRQWDLLGFVHFA